MPHKIEMPQKIGPKIHYVKQNFARTHLVRISQILMNHWRVLKNTSASILHDRIPKQTSPVYTKINGFWLSGYFQIHPPPGLNLRPAKDASPTPPHQIQIWDSWTLRCVANRGREHQQWHLSESTKTPKNWRIFHLSHRACWKNGPSLCEWIDSSFFTRVFVPRLTISI